MDRTDPTADPPNSSPAANNPEVQPAGEPPTGSHPTGPSHHFEVQKEVHRQIRNDPDYDDWEYGTEPLPQEPETWINPKTPG
jgi:hypothetical protein